MNDLFEPTVESTAATIDPQALSVVGSANRLALTLNQQFAGGQSISANALLELSEAHAFLKAVATCDAFSPALHQEVERVFGIDAAPIATRLAGSLAMSMAEWVNTLADLLVYRQATCALALRRIPVNDDRVLDVLREVAPDAHAELTQVVNVDDHPHARYPTSLYRRSSGHVLSSSDGTKIEALASQHTMMSVRITRDVLDPGHPLLRNLYAKHGRCVAVIDERVDDIYGDALADYFSVHQIALDVLRFRSMEVDKGIQTVERMLGEFKRVGVSRQQPVLVIGGGVLSDTAGLACALYHRNTPYVMLSTSIVSGIDAGPSPRTCCDGFGYKNLFGAYHAPVLAITDRSFFGSLRTGWLRHGVAEIIKMAVVKDAKLFEMLEAHGPALIESKFAAKLEDNAPQSQAADKVLGAAMRSYVEAEYGNLYETHQARPHAYGHTWSPGFEIPAGLLHGHAVSIGMAWGAWLSWEHQWISETARDRILKLISDCGLSLWHDVLLDTELLWRSQQRMVEKRGGQLAAPLPRGQIGECGYLDALPRDAMQASISRFQKHCERMPRGGHGLEPLCADVGLEDPSTVGQSTCDGHHAH